MNYFKEDRELEAFDLSGITLKCFGLKGDMCLLRNYSNKHKMEGSALFVLF
jgi:hypothetical protein